MAGFHKSALLSVPCASWQLKQLTPCVYMRLVTKSLPCMRFLWAVLRRNVNVVSPSLCSSSFRNRPDAGPYGSRRASHRPFLQWGGQGLPLRMALNAGVGGVNVVERAGLRYSLRGCHVIAAWAVTLFAADIPLGHFLGAHIIIDRVAAIAGRSVGRSGCLPDNTWSTSVPGFTL